MKNRYFLALSIAAVIAAFVGSSSSSAADSLEVPLERNDRVVFIGNTFAERLQMFSYFETLLTTRLPERDLSFRNLSRSADEVALRPRPLNFGDLHSHLREESADVIVACFGMNEAFEGPDHLNQFAKDMAGFVDTLRTTPYNGSSPPEVVLVSPIAHEHLERIPLDPSEHNRSLQLYTQAMKEYSESHENVYFVDLYAPTKTIMENPSAVDLTHNGIHLTEHGYWVVSQLMGEALGLQPRLPRIRIDAAAGEVLSAESPVANIVSTGPSLAFRVSQAARSLPEAPSDQDSPELLEPLKPVVEINNLESGRYRLRIGERIAGEADAEEWNEGVTVSPRTEPLEQLRSLINHKNQLWFYRYRAVNGEYIYGRRREPFGVQNFPGEMARLEQMIRSEEHQIWSLARDLLYEIWRLEPVDRAVDASAP